jgi:hypothetical protein
MAKTADPKEGQELQLKVNPTVAKLAEIGRQEEIVSLEGFVGPSEPDFVRLYFDLELSGYLEVPKRAVKHAEELDKEKREKGPVRIYVPASTMVRHVRQTFLPAKDRPERLRPDTVLRAPKALICMLAGDMICTLEKIKKVYEDRGMNTSEIDKMLKQWWDIHSATGCGEFVLCVGEVKLQ